MHTRTYVKPSTTKYYNFILHTHTHARVHMTDYTCTECIIVMLTILFTYVTPKTRVNKQLINIIINLFI